MDYIEYWPIYLAIVIVIIYFSFRRNLGIERFSIKVKKRRDGKIIEYR